MTAPAIQNSVSDFEVYEQVELAIKTLEGFGDGNVWLMMEPLFLGVSFSGDLYVQVVPGSGIDEDQGGTEYGGLISETITLYMFKRLFLDITQHDTEAIRNASHGVFVLMNAITDHLKDSRLNDHLIISMQPTQRSPGPRAPEHAMGWSAIARTFTCTYKTDYNNG